MFRIWKKYSQGLRRWNQSLARNWKLIFAVVSSSVLALLVGLLTNIAANYLAPGFATRPWLVWIALGVAFMLFLPFTIYLSLRDSSTPTPVAKQRTESVAIAPLPPRPYQRFFGRDNTLNEILSALRDPSGRWAIGIDGMGGIGKTSLARAVAEGALEEDLFEAVIWEPQTTAFSLGTTMAIDWIDPLIDVGRQLGAPDIKHLPNNDKITRLADLLKQHKVLLIFDNLETSVNSQSELINHLLPLLDYSKALFTSRHRFKDDLYTVHLDGLDEESALLLIRFEAQERGIKRVINASSYDLRIVIQATGRSPLAIKLVVGQLQSLPIEQVIEALKDVRADTDDIAQEEYAQFYKKIFWNSWQLLSEDAKRLLISMAIFAPGVGGTFEAITKTSALNDDILARKIVDELWRFSFLEISGGVTQRDTRYYLHQLTQYFVVSDIVNPPESVSSG